MMHLVVERERPASPGLRKVIKHVASHLPSGLPEHAVGPTSGYRQMGLDPPPCLNSVGCVLQPELTMSPDLFAWSCDRLVEAASEVVG